uniref:Uncharacterized protein n=1 Tax=Trypanosoma vivax (strain Y486) TaxID=1055687 RepID=G0TRT7_TRYVY|nr:hypothetical protein, unlikely [Trypanosoma vivax Y486]
MVAKRGKNASACLKGAVAWCGYEEKDERGAKDSKKKKNSLSFQKEVKPQRHSDFFHTNINGNEVKRNLCYAAFSAKQTPSKYIYIWRERERERREKKKMISSSSASALSTTYCNATP